VASALGACSSSAPHASPSATASPDKSYNAKVLALHPVAFWNIRADSVTEPDLTGNGHIGRYQHGLPAQTRLPDGAPAADFNGHGQYLRVPSSPMFSVGHTGQLTWEAWIRPTALQFDTANDPHNFGYVDWMGKCQDYVRACEWEARMYSTMNAQHRCNRLSAYAFNLTGGLGSGADWQPVCGVIRADSWLYVVGEYQTLDTPPLCKRSDPGTINIWVDGVEQSFAAHAPTGCMSQYRIRPESADSPLNIGTMARDSWFPGAIGKVAIYGKLLTQAQIDAHYEAMTGTLPRGSCAEMCTLSAGA
jgi:Concanavalin A-like lectin/glucanases superfamily